MNDGSDPRLPAGTLTFLLTDVEGSTRQWQRFPAAMQAAAARHDALTEALVAEHGGVLVRPRGEGDSRFAVFARATRGVAAAAALQRALTAEPWPLPEPLRVRIALHTGEDLARDGDYYGQAVNRCARLRSAAHGGQILLSQATVELVRDDLPANTGLRDLGTHRLRDLERPEHVYQLVVAGLPAEFPPLQAPGGPRTNLPVALTAFIGREREKTDVKRLLRAERLLTIIGSGGVGKTRLALEVAAGLMDDFADGVWLVELAALADAGLVPQHVALALGIHEAAGRPLLDVLLEAVRDKAMLLVLDNCEHLVGAVAPLAERLLRAAPGLRLLATSREPLRVSGEVAWRIPSLPSPPRNERVSPEQLLRYEAVQLFVNRAVAARADFALSDQNAAAVAQICVRLDGVPLAIELAAARVRALALDELAARLDDRFRVLVGGSSTAAARQQTLRALIDWSYDLLADDERVLLRRLAVFAGGWTLPAAEAVCAGGALVAADVLDLLARLVDKSLVVSLDDSGGRYVFLESIREYSRERLDASDETGRFERRHADYFLQLAENANGALWQPEQVQWLRRLEAEHDNVRAALECLARVPGGEAHLLRLASLLWRFWEVRGHVSEGRAWLAQALARHPEAPAHLRASGLRGAGILARLQGDYEQAKAMHEESLALFRAEGYTLGVARELDVLGELAQIQGDAARATELHTESLTLRYELDDREGIAVSLGHLGNIARRRGQPAQARQLLDESLRLHRARGDRLYTALALNHLGQLAGDLCEYDRASVLYEEALALYRELRDQAGIADTLQNLGQVKKDQCAFHQAMRLYQECLALRQALGDRRGVARATADLAEVLFYLGHYPRAAELAEQSLAVFREVGARREIVISLSLRAFVAQYQGDYDLTLGLAAEGLELATAIDYPLGIAYAKQVLGLAAYAQGQLAAAHEQLQAALGIFRTLGDRRNAAHCLIHLARTAYRLDDPASAGRCLDESLSIARALDIGWSLAFSFEIRGLLERSSGQYARASELFLESLRLSVDQENQQGIANGLGALAGLAAVTGKPATAVHLFAAAEQLRATIGARMGGDDRLELERYLAALHDRLDDDAFDALWQEGLAMTVVQALEAAGKVVTVNASGSPRSPRSPRSPEPGADPAARPAGPDALFGSHHSPAGVLREPPPGGAAAG